MRAVREHGLRVADDVSIVGFDELFLSSYTDPPLTTIEQPKHEMGSRPPKSWIPLRTLPGILPTASGKCSASPPFGRRNALQAIRSSKDFRVGKRRRKRRKHEKNGVQQYREGLKYDFAASGGLRCDGSQQL